MTEVKPDSYEESFRNVINHLIPELGMKLAGEENAGHVSGTRGHFTGHHEYGENEDAVIFEADPDEGSHL